MSCKLYVRHVYSDIKSVSERLSVCVCCSIEAPQGHRGVVLLNDDRGCRTPSAQATTRRKISRTLEQQQQLMIEAALWDDNETQYPLFFGKKLAIDHPKAGGAPRKI